MGPRECHHDQHRWVLLKFLRRFFNGLAFVSGLDLAKPYSVWDGRVNVPQNGVNRIRFEHGTSPPRETPFKLSEWKSRRMVKIAHSAASRRARLASPPVRRAPACSLSGGRNVHRRAAAGAVTPSNLSSATRQGNGGEILSFMGCSCAAPYSVVEPLWVVRGNLTPASRGRTKG